MNKHFFCHKCNIVHFNCLIIWSLVFKWRNSKSHRSQLGTAVAQWLRCCATNRKVAGSILFHEYMFEVLCKYGFSERFRKRIWNIYKNSTSSVQINGYRSCPFPIKSCIHQGCPLSMILYAMCLNPLLCTLENSVYALRMGRHHARSSVVAYADDVTIFVTTPTEIPKLQEAIHSYEAASGSRLNIQKSRAIAFGTWDKSIEIMNIPNHDTETILGFQIRNTVGESALASWTKTTEKIRTQAQETYCRMLTLDKRIQFSHE